MIFFISLFIIIYYYHLTVTLFEQLAQSGTRVLVVVFGMLRATNITWQNFQKNVLQRLNADLALCISEHDGINIVSTDDPFIKAAKYHWIIPQTKDKNGKYELVNIKDTIDELSASLPGATKGHWHSEPAKDLSCNSW